jgi:xylulokinase
VRRLAPGVLGVPDYVRESTELVADGAARQAAWVLSGTEELPAWSSTHVRIYEATPETAILEQYRVAARRHGNQN